MINQCGLFLHNFAYFFTFVKLDSDFFLLVLKPWMFRVKDIVFSFLTSDEFELNKMDAEDPEISDYIMIPDTAWLADTPRVCLQVSYIRLYPAYQTQTNYIRFRLYHDTSHRLIISDSDYITIPDTG